MLFVFSFISLQFAADPEQSATGGLARVVTFLTWQIAAFVVAAVGAIVARVAVQRGVVGIKAWGYVPLGLSVFLVATFVALVGIRFYVTPLFE